MTEAASQTPEIVDLTSKHDLDIFETNRLKYVDMLLPDGSRLVRVGPERQLDHWKLTGMNRDEAREAKFHNAGIMRRRDDGKWQLIVGSGELKARNGYDFMQVVQSDRDSKDKWDTETADYLNNLFGEETFIAKSIRVDTSDIK